MVFGLFFCIVLLMTVLFSEPFWCYFSLLDLSCTSGAVWGGFPMVRKLVFIGGGKKTKFHGEKEAFHVRLFVVAGSHLPVQVRHPSTSQ